MQAINLAFVPNDYQVLVMNLASIPWNMFISYMHLRQETSDKEKDKKEE